MSDIDDDEYAYDGLDDGLDDEMDDSLGDSLGDSLEDGQDDEAADVLEVPDDTGLVDVEGDPVTEAEVEAAEQAIPEVDEETDDVVGVPIEDEDSEDDIEESSPGPTYTGNQWDSRDYGPEAPNQNPYHYSNSDGSYYYDNPDGSKYYNDGQSAATYTAPSGLSYRKNG